MTFLIVNSRNKRASETLQRWYTGRSRQELKSYFIRRLDPNTFLVRAHWEIMVMVWALNIRSKGGVRIFATDPIEEWRLPKELIRAAEYASRGLAAKREKKGLTPTREEREWRKLTAALSTLTVDCSVSLSVSSSKQLTLDLREGDSRAKRGTRRND